MGSLSSNSKWVLIGLGTISKAASLSYLAQSGAGAAGAPGHLGAVSADSAAQCVQGCWSS